MSDSDAIAVAASAEPVGEVDERYLSFCVDLGQIAEPTRFWNPDGSGETLGTRRSFDFGDARLRNLCRALAPAYLRIGGTEADRVYYHLDEGEGAVATGAGAGAEAVWPVAPPPPPGYASVLTAAHLRGIGDFARDVGLHISFALNAGWGARHSSAHARADGSAAPWDSTQARALMRFAVAEGVPLAVYELGNEPNAWPLFHNPPLYVSPEAHAADIGALASARDAEAPDASISAPGTAWWPAIGEVPALLPPAILPPRRPRFARSFLPRLAAASAELAARGGAADILSWHFYPALSDRSALARLHPKALPAAFAAAALAAAVLAAAAAAPAPALAAAALALFALAIVLCALCLAVRALVVPVRPGTLHDPAVLDNCRAWARQVRAAAAAQAARGGAAPRCWLGETGSAQVGGQPGVSGTWGATLWWLDQLGLLALEGQEVQCRQTLAGSDYGLLAEASLEPTPDFWASVLWRRTMGSSAFAVKLPPGAPRTLRVYCHTARAGTGGRPGARSFLVLNLGCETAVLRLQTAAAAQAQRLSRSPRPTRRQPTAAAAASAAAADSAADSAAAECEVVETWLLDAPAMGSRLVNVNGSAPSAARDGTVPPLRAVRRRAGGGGVVSIPPGAALFATVAPAV